MERRELKNGTQIKCTADRELQKGGCSATHMLSQLKSPLEAADENVCFRNLFLDLDN